MNPTRPYFYSGSSRLISSGLSSSSSIKTMLLFFTALLFSAFASADVETRILSNGKLVLENIPEIPESIIEDLNRFQNVRPAPVRDWTRDGKSLYIGPRFISPRFGDVSQLHKVDKLGGARYQLTFWSGLKHSYDTHLTRAYIN